MTYLTIFLVFVTTIVKTRSLNEQTNHYFQQTYEDIKNSAINYATHCPEQPPNLRGSLIVDDLPNNFSLKNNSIYHNNIEVGGQYRPKHCLARHRVALIIPYRDRWEILTRFLFHTHHFLPRQQLDYRIYVCEQAFHDTFNKGILINACYKEILKLQPDVSCVMMHDVDLLSLDDRNMYTCPMFPRHLSAAIDKFRFNLPYETLVGGVLIMRRKHYELVNGYSNNYWGWGGEDDDMYERIDNKKLRLERPPTLIGRYTMIKHAQENLNPDRFKLLNRTLTNMDSDGLNSVKYDLLKTTLYHLFTHFYFYFEKDQYK